MFNDTAAYVEHTVKQICISIKIITLITAKSIGTRIRRAIHWMGPVVPWTDAYDRDPTDTHNMYSHPIVPHQIKPSDQPNQHLCALC